MKSPPYQEGDSTLFNLHDEGSDSTPSHTADKYGPTLSVSDDAHMAVDCPFVYSSNTTWTPCTPPTGRVNVNTKTLIQAPRHRFRGYLPVAKIAGI